MRKWIRVTTEEKEVLWLKRFCFQRTLQMEMKAAGNGRLCVNREQDVCACLSFLWQ